MQVLSEWQVYEWHCESGYDLFDSPLSPHNETLPVCDPVWDIDNLTFSLFLPEDFFSIVYLLFNPALSKKVTYNKKVWHLLRAEVFGIFTYQYTLMKK